MTAIPAGFQKSVRFIVLTNIRKFIQIFRQVCYNEATNHCEIAGTQDDVLIIADPYDTTDHNQDGYVIKGFERLVYGWGSAFEKKFGGYESCDFIVAFPTEGHEDVIEALGL